MKKKFINYTLLILIVLASFKILFKGLDERTVSETLKASDPRYLFVGLGCMLLYWGLEAYMMDNLIKRVEPKAKFWTALKSTIIGQYYSFLTPFASGGQPMQLYHMGKDKLPMGGATAVLVSKFLLFQITVTLYSMLLFFVRVPHVLSNLSPATSFVLLGLTINTIGLTAIILMAFKPHTVSKVGHFVIEGLYRFRLLKHKEKAYDRLGHITDEYHDAMMDMLKDWKNTLSLFGLSILQLTVFFSITYCVYLSLGLRGASFIEIISLQAMLYMAVSFVPVPGTAGASEVGFSLLLGSIFTSHLVAMAILLWRGISFYFGLIFCGLFTLYVHLQDKYWGGLNTKDA